MSYSLSFANDFFCDDDPDRMQSSQRPKSVYQAILSLHQDTWTSLARDVFAVKRDQLDPFAVLEQVRRTNTCSNLDSPVRVWIDDEGRYELLVHEQ